MRSSARDTRLKAILAREFRAALEIGPRTRVTVRFTADETILVRIGKGPYSKIWKMEIGSDDDEFCFYREPGPSRAKPARLRLTFPIPDDWFGICSEYWEPYLESAAGRLPANNARVKGSDNDKAGNWCDRNRR